MQTRKVNWSWVHHGFGARALVSASHGHRLCALEETVRRCKSGDSSARDRADADADEVRECEAGAVVGERSRRSRHHRLWGLRASRIVFGDLVQVRRELMSRSRSVLARMTVEDLRQSRGQV